MERDLSAPATVEVYVRSLSPNGSPQQQPLFDRLNKLSMEGVVDLWTVHVVGEEVCLDTAKATRPGRFICDRIQQFKAWARRNDMSFGAFFEQKQATSQFTGEAYERMVFPSVTLAEFDEQDTLQFVAPSSDEEIHHTPATRLDEWVDGRGENAERTMGRH